MVAILRVLATFVADLFKSRRRLEAENLCLRHQLKRLEATTGTSAAARQRSRAAGVDDPVVAELDRQSDAKRPVVPTQSSFSN